MSKKLIIITTDKLQKLGSHQYYLTIYHLLF